MHFLCVTKDAYALWDMSRVMDLHASLKNNWELLDNNDADC